MSILVIVLTIIAAIIALIALLLIFGRIKVRIISKEKVKVIVSVLGIRFTVFSNEKKEPKLKNLSRCRHPDRVLKKEVRKRKKAARAAMKKREKSRQKALKKKQQKAQSAQISSPTLTQNIDTVLTLLKKLREVTRGKLTLHIRRMKIAVGSEDAAKTAILYGLILQSTAYLLEWAKECFAQVRSAPGRIAIIPDYTSERCRAEIDLACYLSLSQALGIAIRMLIAYRKANGAPIRDMIEEETDDFDEEIDEEIEQTQQV